MNTPRLIVTLALGGLLTAQAQADSAVAVSTAGQQAQRDGETLYHTICQACHMDQGQGAKGAAAYPALANNPRLAAAAYPIYMVANGQSGMPAFKSSLSDEEIAAVVGYIRSHFGNQYTEPVTLQDVRNVTRR
ncbi:Cytochrome c, mono-and diheme variants [Geopseudomonas sagittaria]|uniref:Cytochrome c, mono-and diheme variants n=1 Tax=Geopseudomonas sagittaria TaxID=1135990 RepID=A0A1I5XHA8_9GAMM|nr:cytochrome c [Pseudomonas sagittaria]MCM2329670.1 cytochrome c [Pseudomonas sagittaria]SFQ31342.1 Cytochrome c, mono-and diheme variants [Pseudomonas sagittaria]